MDQVQGQIQVQVQVPVLVPVQGQVLVPVQVVDSQVLVPGTCSRSISSSDDWSLVISVLLHIWSCVWRTAVAMVMWIRPLSGFLSRPQDGVLLGAVGAYDWNGAVLKETKHGKVVPPQSSYGDQFPEELKNHAAYLGNLGHLTLAPAHVHRPITACVSGYSLGSLVGPRGAQLYVAGAPRFNHSGKVLVFTLKNNGDLSVLDALLGEQVTSLPAQT